MCICSCVALAGQSITYENIKELRRSRDLVQEAEVNIFFNVVIPCLVGRNEWDRQCTESLISDFVSPSIEALGLWIIDNYSDKWMTGGQRTEKAKYTSVKQGNKLFGGWNEAGVQRFNGLILLVRENREEDNGVFERKFRVDCQEKLARIEESKFEACTDKPLCCLDDLEDDDSDSMAECAEHLQRLRNSTLIPTVIDVHPNSVAVLENNIDIPDLSVASRTSSSSHTSSSRAPSLYGSYTNVGSVVRNKTAI